MPERNRRLRLLASFLALRMSRTQQVCGRTGIEMLSGIFTLEHLLWGCDQTDSTPTNDKAATSFQNAATSQE